MPEPGKNGNGLLLRWVAGVLGVLFTTAVVGIATSSLGTRDAMRTLTLQLGILDRNVASLNLKIEQMQAEIHRLELQRERDLRGSP